MKEKEPKSGNVPILSKVEWHLLWYHGVPILQVVTIICGPRWIVLQLMARSVELWNFKPSGGNLPFWVLRMIFETLEHCLEILRSHSKCLMLFLKVLAQRNYHSTYGIGGCKLNATTVSWGTLHSNGKSIIWFCLGLFLRSLNLNRLYPLNQFCKQNFFGKILLERVFLVICGTSCIDLWALRGEIHI